MAPQAQNEERLSDRLSFMETTSLSLATPPTLSSSNPMPSGRFTGLLLLLVVALLELGCAEKSVRKTVSHDAELSRVRVNGTLLHVVEEGLESAEIVFVLHGGPGADHQYLKVLEPLSDDYRVVWYDQRGTGLSSRNNDWSGDPIDTYLEDLNELTELYGGGQKVHLIGHSWGAMLASAFAGKYPQKVKGLVLAEPGFFTAAEAGPAMSQSPSVGAIAQISGAWLGKWGVTGPDEESRDDWFFTQALSVAQPAGYFCEGKIPEAIAPVRAGAGIYQATVGRAQSDDAYFKAMDFRAGAERVLQPVLFLAGSCDTVIGQEHQKRLAAHYPTADVAVIQDAGHYMFNDQPEASLAEVRRYLGQFSGTLKKSPRISDSSLVD